MELGAEGAVSVQDAYLAKVLSVIRQPCVVEVSEVGQFILVFQWFCKTCFLVVICNKELLVFEVVNKAGKSGQVVIVILFEHFGPVVKWIQDQVSHAVDFLNLVNLFLGLKLCLCYYLVPCSHRKPKRLRKLFQSNSLSQDLLILIQKILGLSRVSQGLSIKELY